MTLSQIASACWENREIVDFGGTSAWETETFLRKWFTNKSLDYYNSQGLYWFQVDYSIDKLRKLATPSDLPDNAIVWSQRANGNSLFTSNICHRFAKLNVIYNGEADKILSRLRAHFFVNSNSTGALGIKYYNLSNQEWQASYFSIASLPNLESLNPSQKQQIKRYLENKNTRIAIEAAWRFIYGWPILSNT